MSRAQQEYSEEEKLEITKRFEKSRNAGEQKRLLCLKLRVVNGKTAKEITEITGYTKSSVDNMISRYHHQGLKPFLYRKRPGNNRKLTAEEEKELLSRFEDEANAGKILTAEDIHKAYEEKAGSSVTLRTVYYMLSRNGWRKIKPRSKHPKKASDEEIKAYKKNQ